MKGSQNSIIKNVTGLTAMLGFSKESKNLLVCGVMPFLVLEQNVSNLFLWMGWKYMQNILIQSNLVNFL